MVKRKIENVVASTSLGEELDLKAIARVLGGAEYEPQQFPGLIYRLKEPGDARRHTRGDGFSRYRRRRIHPYAMHTLIA